MAKPLENIFVDFLDFYHQNRAAKDHFASRAQIKKEADLAFRMAVLFAETAVLPASSYFESALCKSVLRPYQDFIYYGAVKLAAGDPSIAEHIDSKQASYDERSPEHLLKAYRIPTRGRLPGYVQKRTSSTALIRQGWMSVIERTDPRNVLDPRGSAGLGPQAAALWPRIPELLDGRAFVPSHVADLFEAHGFRLPSQHGLNTVIEPLYIDGYSIAFDASIIAGLPLLTSAFEDRLSGRKSISFGTTVNRLEGLGLLNVVRDAESERLFSMRCNPQWDILAADILADNIATKESTERSEMIARSVERVKLRNSRSADKTHQISLPITKQEEVMIGILTALPEEYVAVEALLDDIEPLQAEGDPESYVVGTIRHGKSKHKVALMQLARMRNDSAAASATNLFRTFPKIELLVFSGIALGIPNPEDSAKHVRLGDIIVSDRKGIIELDHLSLDGSGSKNRSNLPPPSAAATRGINTLDQLALKNKRPWLDYLGIIIGKHPDFSRPGEKEDVLLDPSGKPISHPDDAAREPGIPRVFRGAIGSGNALVRDPAYRDRMRNEHGILAIEMEGAGTAESAWQFGKSYVVIRSACDYGSPKNDLWHKYTAAAAAAYTRALIEQVKL
jgi:nucleoside phosphorylase